MLYLDKIGRRKMIIACSIWQACVLAIQGGVAVNVPVSSPRVHMIIACNLLFNASYNAGFSSAIHALVAEIPQQRLRAKSQLMSGICTVAVGWGLLTIKLSERRLWCLDWPSLTSLHT